VEEAMRVRELLQRKGVDVITVRQGTPLEEATHLMMRHGIGGLPVVDDAGRVTGFLSERDVVRAVDDGNGSIAAVRVERVMQRPPPLCDADAPLQRMMSEMTRERHRHIVVTEGGRLAGVLSVGDVVKHRLEQLETETGVLRDYVAAQRAAP
jgi:CBS domain-containing protein